jgi:hypothetical protein
MLFPQWMLRADTWTVDGITGFKLYPTDDTAMTNGAYCCRQGDTGGWEGSFSATIDLIDVNGNVKANLGTGVFAFTNRTPAYPTGTSLQTYNFNSRVNFIATDSIRMTLSASGPCSPSACYAITAQLGVAGTLIPSTWSFNWCFWNTCHMVMQPPYQYFWLCCVDILVGGNVPYLSGIQYETAGGYSQII